MVNVGRIEWVVILNLIWSTFWEQARELCTIELSRWSQMNLFCDWLQISVLFSPKTSRTFELKYEELYDVDGGRKSITYMPLTPHITVSITFWMPSVLLTSSGPSSSITTHLPELGVYIEIQDWSPVTIFLQDSCLHLLRIWISCFESSTLLCFCILFKVCGTHFFDNQYGCRL